MPYLMQLPRTYFSRKAGFHSIPAKTGFTLIGNPQKESYNFSPFSKSPREVPTDFPELYWAASFPSTSSGWTSSARAFILRLILPLLVFNTFTFTVSPVFSTSLGALIRFWLIWDTCTRPLRPWPRSTKAP